MKLSSKVKFTLIKLDGTRYPIADEDIGNLESFEIVYEYEPLESSPLVSSTELHLQGNAMDIVLTAFNNYEKLLYLELVHPELATPFKYSIDIPSLENNGFYIKVNLVLLNLYNMLAGLKTAKFDVDLNAIPSYPIKLPSSLGVNRILFYSGMDGIDTNTHTICSATNKRAPAVYRLSTGWVPVPMTHYRSEIVNPDAFLTNTTSPSLHNESTGFTTEHPYTLAGAGTASDPYNFTGIDIYNFFYSTHELISQYLMRYYGKTKVQRADILIPNLGNLNINSVFMFNGIALPTRGAIGSYYSVLNVRLALLSINTASGFAVLEGYVPLGTAQSEPQSLYSADKGVELIIPFSVPITEATIPWYPTKNGDWHSAFRIEFEITTHFTTSFTSTGAYVNGPVIGFKNVLIDTAEPILLDLTYLGEFNAKAVNGYRALDLLRAGLNQMIKASDYGLPYINAYIDNIDHMYTSGMSYEMFLVPEESIKNAVKKVYYFKLDDFVKTMYGFGYQLYSTPNSISFRKRAKTAYATITIPEIGDFTMKQSDVLKSSVEIGYDLDDASIGLLDPHRRSTFKSNIPYSIDGLQYTVPYRADAIGILRMLDSISNRADSTDKWWTYIKDDSAKLTDSDSTDAGVFVLLCVYNNDIMSYEAPSDGAPEELASLNLFNWSLSVVGLLYFMAKYLSYSGNRFILSSSYGVRSGTVKLFTYGNSNALGVPIAPVIDVDYLLALTPTSTEKYGGIELSTTIVLTAKQMESIITSNALGKNVLIRLPSLGVSGVLLKASMNLVFDKAVDITMLVDAGVPGYHTPTLGINEVVPKVNAISTPSYVVTGTSKSYTIFINTVAPIDFITYYGSQEIPGNIGCTLDTSMSIQYRRFIQVKVSNIHQIPVGSYNIGISMVLTNNTVVTIGHTLKIT